jgi:serine/threonine protein kinase/tetratricopeptide (TPR) repeat protein
MPLTSGTKLGRYEIQSPLGAGGMGEVYRATDTKLGRDIALKVLPAEMAEDPERLGRFRREAKTLAQLDHPNIVTIHSVEDADGIHFLTMQLVEGLPLNRLIPQGGQPVEQIVEIASALGDALAAAHEKGIVHRDLKPANVMISTEGRVKVLDFGLAKDIRAANSSDATMTSDSRTQIGVVMGTPAYMSPEQVSGRTLDHRSDIFSLGVVLHEMATGRRPFEGGSSAELISSILRDTPPPVNELRPELPADLARVIRRCLEKDPRYRLQTARDVSNEFRDLGRTITRPTPVPTSTAHAAVAADSGAVRDESGDPYTQGFSGIKRHRIALAIAVIGLVIGSVGVAAYLKRSNPGQIESIAVLPLENRSNNPDDGYISDGITESVNNSLARLPALSVTPHSVAFHYKGKAMDVRKIGDELHVEAILAGSVAQRGDDLTIDVELDDVRNGKQLWGEQYHRKLADLLAVQSDIAKEVSQRLRSQLSLEAQKDLTKGSTANPEAYRLYLKGKYHTYKLTKEGFDTGIDYFNQAIAIDPNYALAYSGLAFNYINQEDWHLPPNEGVPKAKEAAKHALAIDDSDAGAHLVLAIAAYWYDWDWAAAEREFRRSIELNPNSSDAYWYYGWFLASMRRNDQAIAEVKRSQQIDPLTVFPTAGVGTLYLFTRQWDPAIEQLHHAIAIDPNFWFSYSFLGRAYEQKGKLPEAIAQFQRAVELEKENAEIWSGLGNAYAVSGNRAAAQKVLDHLKELSAHSWVAPYNVAVIYAGLGDKDQAFALLERAYQDRSYYMPSFLTMDERLDNLHSDPRYAALVKRVGLPE